VHGPGIEPGHVDATASTAVTHAVNCDLNPSMLPEGDTALRLDEPDIHHELYPDGVVRFAGEATSVTGDLVVQLLADGDEVWSAHAANCDGAFSGSIHVPPTLAGPLELQVSLGVPGEPAALVVERRAIVVG
jgi:hypothetical protein